MSQPATDYRAPLAGAFHQLVTLIRAEMAQEGYDAARRQEVVRIPGLANQMTALWVQSQPRWLVRTIGGLFGRQFMK